MKTIVQHNFKITYELPEWAFVENRICTITVTAINKETARMQYYKNLRGNSLPHDIRLISIEEIA